MVLIIKKKKLVGNNKRKKPLNHWYHTHIRHNLPTRRKYQNAFQQKYGFLEMGFYLQSNKKDESKQLTNFVIITIYGQNMIQNLVKTMKMEAHPTCNPLPIIRLTALLPPPPTPTTLILADSMGANEQETPKRRRFQIFPRIILGEKHFP